MDAMFRDLDIDTALEIEQLARLMFEVRNARQTLLANFGVATAEVLLERIESGEFALQPAYTHYLSACILDQLLNDIRSALASQAAVANGTTSPAKDAEAACLLPGLAEAAQAYGGDNLAAPVESRLDALLLHFHNGGTLEARFAAPDAYGLTWTREGATRYIDTAPRADGTCLDAPYTRRGAAPWDNLCAVIDAVLADPALSNAATS